MKSPTPLLLSVSLALLLLPGCFDRGDLLVNGVEGQLSVGPGVVFIERGNLHEGTFERAGVIGADGTFSVRLEGTGTHGFHAYVENFLYLPIEVEVEDGVLTTITQTDVNWDFLCDRGGNCEWVEQTTVIEVLTPGDDTDLANNPIIRNPSVTRRGEGTFEVSVEVEDPDADLSVQILVHHLATGTGLVLNPPGPVVDGNYPNGLYTRTIFLAEGADDSGPWQFVAADHGCSNSTIMQVDPQ